MFLNIRHRSAVHGDHTVKLTLKRGSIAKPKIHIGLAEGKLNFIGTGLQKAHSCIQKLRYFTEQSIITVRHSVNLQLTEQCFIVAGLCLCDNLLDLFLVAAVIGQQHFGIAKSGRKRNIALVESYHDSLCLVRFNSDKLTVLDSGDFDTADIREICHGAIISLMWSIRSVFVLSASYSIVYAPQIFS